MFDVGQIYSAQDSFHQEYFLFVLKLSKSGRALYGAIYDRTYGLVSRRWCRVSASLGNSFFAFSGSFIWESKNSIFPSCFPPEEVLDYFRNEKSALQQF